MKKWFLGVAMLFLALVMADAAEQDTVNRCAIIIDQFQRMPEKAIPREVLRHAKGLAVMSVVKAGFIFSAKGGQGIVVARTPQGWSGPSFIATGGGGWGLQAGAEVTDFVIVLNNNAAVQAFSRGGNLTVGADLSANNVPVLACQVRVPGSSQRDRGRQRRGASRVGRLAGDPHASRPVAQ